MGLRFDNFAQVYARFMGAQKRAEEFPGKIEVTPTATGVDITRKGEIVASLEDLDDVHVYLDAFSVAIKVAQVEKQAEIKELTDKLEACEKELLKLQGLPKPSPSRP